MTRRVADGRTLALAYDAENRLVKVCEDGNNPAICDAGETVVAQFTFDADGKRIKSVMGGETILFVGMHYEITNPGSGQTVAKYYLAGSTRIAMRKYTIPQSMTVEYTLGDHLGGANLTTNINGEKVSEMRYRPWGEVRYAWYNPDLNDAAKPDKKTSPVYALNHYTYTGQFSYMDDPTTQATEGFGLMYYNARWYDPSLGRFTQPDTYVSNGSVQGLDRYAYGLNNPSRFTDPSGHVACDEQSEDGRCVTWTANHVLSALGIKVHGTGTKGRWAIADAALISADMMIKISGAGGLGAFQRMHGPITINILNTAIDPAKGNCETIGGTITCSQSPSLANTLHEFGHVIDNHSGGLASDKLGLSPSPDNINGYWERSADGFICPNARCLEHRPSMGYWDGNKVTSDQTSGYARDEQWADLYMNGLLAYTGDPNHGFTNDEDGVSRFMEFMNIIWSLP